MNPLQWKREHQLALLIGAALGCMYGLVFGLEHVSQRGTEFVWRGYDDGLTQTSPTLTCDLPT
jgi:hypothetical protein